MTNTWRRSPGAQPPHQQHLRSFGENVRQRSASSALRLPQGGSRCAPRWWTRREARQLLPLPLLATGLPSAGGPGRAGAPALAPPPAVARGRASARPLRANCGWLPQALHRVRRGHSGHAAKQARHELLTHPGLCRRLDRHSVAPPIPEREQTALPLSQCASFASVPSHARPSVAEPTCGWMDFAGGWTGLQLHRRS
eukprot:SM000057S18341  [mRNA]  locus=s57:18803:19579:- [translate_table: standard]